MGYDHMTVKNKMELFGKNKDAESRGVPEFGPDNVPKTTLILTKLNILTCNTIAKSSSTFVLTSGYCGGLQRRKSLNAQD